MFVKCLCPVLVKMLMILLARETLILLLACLLSGKMAAAWEGPREAFWRPGQTPWKLSRPTGLIRGAPLVEQMVATMGP